MNIDVCPESIHEQNTAKSITVVVVADLMSLVISWGYHHLESLLYY